MKDLLPHHILDFWFAEGMQSKWYFAGDTFDQLLRDRFLAIHTMAKKAELDHWQDTREGRLALILLLDQFSRNIYRGQEKAFATDGKALGIAKHALQVGDDIWLKKNKPSSWRSFLYVVFMHSERLEDQRRCLDLYLTHGPENSIPYAREHMDVIYRYGRFPNRNQALGRISTPEEISFLEAGGVGWDKSFSSKI
jgi:uncharacterized protein (DUF924 family)